MANERTRRRVVALPAPPLRGDLQQRRGEEKEKGNHDVSRKHTQASLPHSLSRRHHFWRWSAAVSHQNATILRISGMFVAPGALRSSH